MNADPASHDKEVTAPDYILENFELSDRIAILVRDSKRGETIQRITTANNAASPDFQAWLRHKNLSSDVYIGMNTLKPDAQSRTKEDIETIRHLYLDIDRRGPEALDAIRKSSAVPPPNYVLQTSPEKFQVVWKVENVSQDQAEGLQRAMVREFGGDPAATDSTRVLRLPTFVNRKYGREHTVAARPEATTTYRLEDFKLRTDTQDEQHQRSVLPDRGHDRSGGEITQSERDWAFAKRALARGDDPEEVVRRIADYRADDKHDPEYYARHTVKKAQAEIGRRPVANDTCGQSTQEFEESREQIEMP
jgi:RepB DNA-primase from phage plasmid